eukprot:756011-Hanusia_phi.AAC.1
MRREDAREGARGEEERRREERISSGMNDHEEQAQRNMTRVANFFDQVITMVTASRNAIKLRRSSLLCPEICKFMAMVSILHMVALRVGVGAVNEQQTTLGFIGLRSLPCRSAFHSRAVSLPSRLGDERRWLMPGACDVEEGQEGGAESPA